MFTDVHVKCIFAETLTSVISTHKQHYKCKFKHVVWTIYHRQNSCHGLFHCILLLMIKMTARQLSCIQFCLSGKTKISGQVIYVIYSQANEESGNKLFQQ